MSATPEGQRLYGVPGAEDMHFDLASAYEAHIDPYVDEHDLRPNLIEEWSVCDPKSHLPGADVILEWLSEWAGEEGMLDEDGYDAVANATKGAEVQAAFDAALDVLASKVPYRMADTKLRTWQITWDSEGEPLADGARIYGKAGA